MGPETCLLQKSPGPHRLLSFAGLDSHRLVRGKFAIAVRFTALGPGVQFAHFLDRCSTGGATHGKYLFLRQFFALHHPCILALCGYKKCSVLLVFQHF